MTAVCSTYIVMAPEGFGLSAAVGYPMGAFAVLLAAGLFFRWRAAFEKEAVSKVTDTASFGMMVL